ncbi:MAG: hypothetical protein H7Z41_01875 [Cytophagales bacterium]|nr:hypothetical protein [Armatimonadota bacterium]
MATKTSGFTGRRVQRGASLVEVLIILVVLLIGIFTAIRVFPIGLATLRTTETRTLAVQLATQQSEQLKADSANLPQGIALASFSDPNTREFDGAIDPDDLTPYNGSPNPYFQDVNKFRFVEGEQVKVPLPVSTGFDTGSIYTVKFGPIYLDPAYGDRNADPATLPNAGLFLRVYSTPLLRITAPYDIGAGNNDNSNQVSRSYLRGLQSYLIDYDGDQDEGDDPAQILLQQVAGNDAIYYISYSYFDGADIKSSPDKVRLIGNGNWRTIPLSDIDPTPVTNIVPGSEQVYIEFSRLAAATNFSTSNPYEYKLLRDNFPDGAGLSFANLGLIAFNPTGPNYGQRNAYGQQGFNALIDYSVLDWHILREDREVPSGAVAANKTVTIRTTLGSIKRKGDPNADNTIYDGMYGPGSDDLQVVNLQTGDVLQRGDLATLDPGADYYVNEDDNGTFRSGIIYINTVRVPQGSQVRVLYKAEGDWAIAVQKAFSRYQLLQAGGFPATNSPKSFTKGIADDTSLFFNRSEYNKSVVAQFRYIKEVDQGGTPVEVVAQTPPQQITLAGSLDNPLFISGNDSFAFTNVGVYMGDRKPGTEWQVVGGVVNGVSVRTRVVYRDSNSGVNTAVQGTVTAPGQRVESAGWRIQDVDTYLTRAR